MFNNFVTNCDILHKQYINFSKKIYEFSRNSRPQNGHVIEAPYWEPTNIKR